MEPMVEILLAAYNGERFLREQLDSLLAQTWTRWHLTVSDDGSTDGTSAILDEYAARYSDRITRVFHEGRFGNARDHFFWLMKQSDASYIFFSDQDDVWSANKVEITMRAMLDAEQVHGGDTPILVFTDLTPADEGLNMIAPSLMRMQKQYFTDFDYRSLMMQNVVTGCAMCINRALARQAGECKDPAQVIMHDWWLGVVAARFGQVVYLDESTMLYRQHGGNSVGMKDVTSLSYIIGRLAHLSDLRALILCKKAQAQVFQASYANELTGSDHAFLLAYVRAHSGPLFYIRYRKLIHGFWRLIGALILG